MSTRTALLWFSTDFYLWNADVFSTEFYLVQWSIDNSDLCETVEGNLTPDTDGESGVSVIKGTVHDQNVNIQEAFMNWLMSHDWLTGFEYRTIKQLN